MKNPLFMIKYYPLLLLLFVIAAACSPSREEQAKLTLEDAVQAYTHRQFNRAKLMLDSVIEFYPEQKATVREARDLMQIVYRTEQENNLHFLDSLLQLREEELKPILAQFYVEDDAVEPAVMIHRRQSTRAAYDRCYLRAHVNRNGEFYLASHYTGQNHIHHNRVRVDVGREYVITDSITTDALNHAFGDGDQVWEVVKYKDGRDNGVASFVARNADKQIAVTLLGRKTKYKFYLTETDRQCIRDTYNLSVMLREIIQIKSQIRNVKKSIQTMKFHPSYQ